MFYNSDIRIEQVQAVEVWNFRDSARRKAAGFRAGDLFVHHGKQCLLLMGKATSFKLLSSVKSSCVYWFVSWCILDRCLLHMNCPRFLWHLKTSSVISISWSNSSILTSLIASHDFDIDMELYFGDYVPCLLQSSIISLFKMHITILDKQQAACFFPLSNFLDFIE